MVVVVVVVGGGWGVGGVGFGGLGNDSVWGEVVGVAGGGFGGCGVGRGRGLVLSQVVRFATWDWSLVDWEPLARGGILEAARQLIGLAMQCRVIARSIEFFCLLGDYTIFFFLSWQGCLVLFLAHSWDISSRTKSLKGRKIPCDPGVHCQTNQLPIASKIPHPCYGSQSTKDQSHYLG